MTAMATYWRDDDGTGELNGIKSAAVTPTQHAVSGYDDASVCEASAATGHRHYDRRMDYSAML
jgi:hypothetical protein